jgi:hypothetical protein
MLDLNLFWNMLLLVTHMLLCFSKTYMACGSKFPSMMSHHCVFSIWVKNK